MKIRALTGILFLSEVMLAGCVSSETHQQTLAELERARKVSADVATAYELSKKQLTLQNQALQEALAREKEALAAVNGRVVALDKEKEQATTSLADARSEVARLQSALRKEQERLKAEEAEKLRLEQERIAKEAEIQRLTKTQQDLSKSLEAEIAQGDIRIKQVRDRLTINMVDRVLFDSGQGQVKPEGLKVLKQVSEVLKIVTDKQIRIEGHTDNVPIGGKLRDRFPSNWELSTTRASSVVRYLIEDGGVDAAKLTAVGHGETRPIASNDTDEGRRANRRIEIVLHPRDFSDITPKLKP